jgi:hypothetical protein
MEKEAFLEQHVFTDLKKIKNDSDQEDIHFFSETDFDIVLQRAEHLGIGVFGIDPWLEGKAHVPATHEEYKKKATDPRWYKKAFLTLRMRTPGMDYSATYKVSAKLLAR